MNKKRSLEERLQSSIQQLEELNLDQIPTDTLDRLWSGDILETDIEQINVLSSHVHADSLQRFIDLFSDFRGDVQDGESSFWASAIEREFPLKNLVIWLHRIIESKNLKAFLAAKFYLILLEIPGSSAYQVFHTFIFRSILNLLKFWKSAQVAELSKELSKAKQAKKRGKVAAPSKPKQRSSPTEAEDAEMEERSFEDATDMIENDDEMEVDQSDEQTQAKAHAQMLEVPPKYASELLLELRKFLSTFGLDKDLDTKYFTIDILADISRLHRPDSTTTKKKKNSEDSSNSISSQCYEILRELLKPLHGNADQTLPLLFKSLIPNLLMTFDLLISGAIPKHIIAVRQDALDFVHSIVKLEDKQLLMHVHALMQNMCTRVPEKAEYRNHAIDSVNEIFNYLPRDEKPRFIKFLQRFSKNVKANCRLFAIELACVLLRNIKAEDSESNSLGEAIAPLFDILIKRCSDKIATVRSKAITNLAAVLEESSANPAIKAEVAKVFSGEIRFGSPDAEKMDILTLLRRRASDEKCGVRKSALQALEVVGLLTDSLSLSLEDLRLFQEKSSDSAVSIRKQAISSLTNMMRIQPTHPVLYPIWLRAVLSSVLDPETSIQEKCIDYFEEIILQPVIAYSKKSEDTSVWVLLNNIEGDLLKYFQKVCFLLGKAKRFSKPLIKALEKSLTNEKLVSGSWLLLSEIAQFCPNDIDYKLVVAEWNKVKDSFQESTAMDNIRMLSVIARLAENIPREITSKLQDDLLSRLKTFRAPPALVQSCVQTLYYLCKANSSTKQANSMIRDWASQLLSSIDTELASYVLPKALTADSDNGETKTEMDSELIIRYLFTMGEVAQICPSAVPSRLVTVVQALISPILNNHGKTTEIPANVRAFSFIALGKLCLEDESLAKKCIPAFAKELETCELSAVRNNIIVILCDMCIKYTALVDKYLPCIAMCLRDPNELVRKQTLILLTRLLQEDFVKWQKGNLFYRFIVSFVDESPVVQNFAKFGFVSLLKTKAPLLFFTHFMETLFYLNNYKQHHTYNQFPQTEKERTVFSLTGADNRGKRMAIYKVFLENMTDEQKFQTIAKLCQEVLAGVVDGQLPLSESGELVTDALSVLGCKEIKLSKPKARAVEDEDVEETAAETSLAAAKEKILTKIVKKNVLENIVPIIIELKHLLEKNRSPLLRILMEYMRELFKDYKDELEDILIADKQLAKEIKFDLQQFNQKRLQSPGKSLLSPRRPMFSPTTTSPRPELANFSVPKVRGATPMKSPGHSLKSQENREPNASPFKGTSTKKVQDTIHVTSIPVQIADSSKSVTNGTPNEESRPRQWNVQLKAVDNSPEEDEVPLKSVKIKAASKRKTSKISPSASESPAKEPPRQRRARKNV